MTCFQFGNVAFYTSIVLLPTIRTWKRGNHSKASLGRVKGMALIGAYITCLCCYAVVMFMAGARGSQ